MAFLDVLFNLILPVFAILVLGFVLGRQKKATVEQARTINWAATTIFLPILAFDLMASAPIESFSFAPLAVYLAVQSLVAGFAFWLALRLELDKAEAVLAAIGTVFVNNAFFVLPISQFFYGSEHIQPVIAIITLDTIVLFILALMSLEYFQYDQASSKPSSSEASSSEPSYFSKSSVFYQVCKTVAKLPLVQAIALGLVINLLGFTLPHSLQTFVDFNGAAAAPLALLALGIMLSQTPIRPDKAVWLFTGFKILLFPVMLWLALQLFVSGHSDNDQFMLISAGPVTTAMFSFGMLYAVPTVRIAQILVLTTGLSLFSLALFA